MEWHQTLPPSLLAKRLIVVLVCYLDDSGKDPQNPITTLAGYVATDDQWRAFEAEVEPWFNEFQVSVLHSKDLHNTDGQFAGWRVLKKQAFVARLCQVLSRHVQLGVSMSVLKDAYGARAKESDRKRTSTPYTFCSAVIIDWLLRDIRVGGAANKNGIALILECGHENNPEVEQYFYSVRELHKLQNVLHSISFVPKDKCRAIQMADLLAFYTRRHGVALERAPVDERPDVSPGTMMNIIAESVPIRSFVATDFGPQSGPQFFAGDP
ncbi:MAG: DUF3800 domain-containing protein [Kiloniellales bacterium]